MKKYQSENNLNGKALLLIDNCPAHPKHLESADGNIVVKFLPKNCTPLIQPMDQNVIAKIKTGYKKRFLSKLFAPENELHFEVALKSFNLLDALRCLNDAWETVTVINIAKSWQNLFEVWDETDDLPLSLMLNKDTENDSNGNEAENNEIQNLQSIYWNGYWTNKQTISWMRATGTATLNAWTKWKWK